MDNLNKSFRNLCRVCLREDLDDDNQLTFLNTQRAEKLTYIGDSSEIIRLDNEPIPLCIKCDIKLDLVYEFIVKFNSSKAKLRELAHIYDPYQVVDLNLEAIDYTAQGRSETFMNIVKVEPIYETPESPFQNGNIDDDPIRDDFRPIEPKIRKPKIGPKSKIKRSNDDTTSKPTKKAKLESRPNQMLIKSEFGGEPNTFRHFDGESNTFRQFDGESNTFRQFDGESTFPQFEGESTIRQFDGALPSDVSSVCYICRKEFSTRANMLRHVREHLGRRFVCEYEGCTSYFTQKSSLQVHIARHKGLKPYDCELCGKKFSQSKSLVFHRRIHTGESPYECDYCEKKFKQKSNLIRHFKCHRKPTKPRQRRFNCPKCEKFLASKQSLIRHLDRHERMDIVPMPITTVDVPAMAVKIEKDIL